MLGSTEWALDDSSPTGLVAGRSIELAKQGPKCSSEVGYQPRPKLPWNHNIPGSGPGTQCRITVICFTLFALPPQTLCPLLPYLAVAAHISASYGRFLRLQSTLTLICDSIHQSSIRQDPLANKPADPVQQTENPRPTNTWCLANLSGDGIPRKIISNAKVASMDDTT